MPWYTVFPSAMYLNGMELVRLLVSGQHFDSELMIVDTASCLSVSMDRGLSHGP